MTDCRCHAGKICEACETEVMGNLNERLKGRTNYHDSDAGLMPPNSIDDIDAHVKMEGKKIGKIVGKFIPEMNTDVSNEPLLYPTPGQMDRDILDELSELRQKVIDMETAKAFHVSIYENIIERLNDVEGALKSFNSTVSSLELQRLRGNG